MGSNCVQLWIARECEITRLLPLLLFCLAITDGYHVQDTKEWTPPPSDDEANDRGDDRSTSVDKYMVLLRRYTELVLYSGRAKKGLWASTTPMMHVSYFQLCPSDLSQQRQGTLETLMHLRLVVTTLTAR